MRAARGRRRAGGSLFLLAALLFAACGGETIETPPDGAPAFDCVGVPIPTCEQILREQRDAARGAAPIVGATIRCTSATCSEAEGEVTISVVFADGTRTESGYGWAMAPPVAPGGPDPDPFEPPKPPVQPTCIGVDEGNCQNAATNALMEFGDPAPIASITVTCGGVCTPTEGSGTTVIVIADGTRQEFHWDYQHQ
jgi:hypothetical protein